MYKYLKIQQAPVTDNITADGHVGARLPWPVIADSEGLVHIPSSQLGMTRIPGFQKNLAVMRVDVWWPEVFADPDKAIGMYLVSYYDGGPMAVCLSAVDSVEVLTLDKPLPLKD